MIDFEENTEGGLCCRSRYFIFALDSICKKKKSRKQMLSAQISRVHSIKEILN